MRGFINVYQQGEERRQRVSPPHSSLGFADRAAERVWRGTGGACVRVEVREEDVPEGRLVD